MSQVTTIKFIDKESGQPGFAAVRAQGAVVGLALSLRDNGDIEVFLDHDVVERLARALAEASSAAKA